MSCVCVWNWFWGILILLGGDKRFNSDASFEDLRISVPLLKASSIAANIRVAACT